MASLQQGQFFGQTGIPGGQPQQPQQPQQMQQPPQIPNAFGLPPQNAFLPPSSPFGMIPPFGQINPVGPGGFPFQPQAQQQQQNPQQLPPQQQPQAPVQQQAPEAPSGGIKITIAPGSVSPLRQQILLQQQQKQQHFESVTKNNPYCAYLAKNVKPSWKENKKMMTALEIDSIIRIQEQQLMTAAIYAEDYYYQNYLLKVIERCQLTGTPLPRDVPAPQIYHDPIVKIQPNTTTKLSAGDDQRSSRYIPNYSNLKAPRSLLDLKKMSQSLSEPSPDSPSNNSSFQLRRVIEDAWDILLDIEDIDIIFRFHNYALTSPQTANELTAKRTELLNQILLLLSIQPVNVSQPQIRGEDAICLFEEDELLLKILVLDKGKKLMLRILNVMSEPGHVYNLFALVARNLALFLVICSESSIEGLGSRVFLGLLSKMTVLSITDVGSILRSTVEFHNDELLQHLLRSTDGLTFMQHFLLHATVSLMQNPQFFLTPNGQVMLLGWSQSFDYFFMRLQNRFDGMFEKDGTLNCFIPQQISHFEFVCNFIKTVSSLSNPAQKGIILTEIQQRMSRVENLDTLSTSAALQLVQALME